MCHDLQVCWQTTRKNICIKFLLVLYLTQTKKSYKNVSQQPKWVLQFNWSRYGYYIVTLPGSNRCVFKHHRYLFLHLLHNRCVVCFLVRVTSEQCVTHGGDDRRGCFSWEEPCAWLVRQKNRYVLVITPCPTLECVHVYAAMSKRSLWAPQLMAGVLSIKCVRFQEL